ncbi:MAG: sigma-54-dependent Fis family transcriptional regulator [Acidobacteria bacterium]|nr:sigma-54-dependent Fis family transcriptional regulator [Acidobacteriota bacterium]MCB9396535.1 sigma-54-dependent Fis family transcriptional regulator [Acidobacteriota bacterium]
MHVQEFSHKELLELEPEGGLIRFAGQRALLIDGIAMGVLRQYLVNNFGVNAARAVLTQFGFAHGWRMASSMRREFQWTSHEDWRKAGPQLFALQGMFCPQSGSEDPLSENGTLLLASYEAEQHLLNFGRSSSTVCWTLCGLMSGYLSKSTGKEIFVLEHRCLAAGHSACQLIGRTREAWGNQHAAELDFYHPKSLKENLEITLSRVTESLKESEEKLRLRQKVLVKVAETPEDESGLVARSASMKKVVDLARRVAGVDATVLITGESGVGKERIARLVHDESTRSLGPFIAVNCGAISETLLESELFGHARGAFTGAVADRPGLFEAANRGTILLDEIGEISPNMQVKLLRVLQEREIRRVGENKSRPVNVRILAATNRDLTEDVGEGSFRQDLYYRLKVVELAVPPLRERKEDIIPLARLLLADSLTRMNRKRNGITPRVADLLQSYAWPGNVRELENAMERAAALSLGPLVDVEDLPEEIRSHSANVPNAIDRGTALHQIEKDYILSVLARNNGNQTQTAKQLDIGSATLYRKLKSYGLIPDRKR